MKNNKKLFKLFTVAVLSLSFFFTQCKKDKETITVTEHDTTYINAWDTGVFVPGTFNIDTSWTFDKVHCNVGWESRFYDFSSTMLTGRFNNFLFTPKFHFNETNLSDLGCDFWVQLSTFNTGESGRDGAGKCGPNYLGIVYLDTNKTLYDPVSDTAWFHGSSVTIDPQSGYIVHGTFTFNRYRPASGYADGTPITKNVTMHLSFNGMRDFDSNNDGTYDKYRAGFTATFSFNRSDYMDINSTVPYWPVPKASEAITNATTAANNKTYGVWSVSVADKMDITVNAEFYKNH
jgi:polyisoprenoid-binding protein YceI